MDRTNDRRFTILICALLTGVTLAVFWPVLHHEFIVYDDHQYILENPHVISGLTLGNLQWAFTSGYASNWHPLTWISHMLDVQLFGLRPGWHHLVNVLFHVANSVLLFLLLKRMTGALWRSAFVAALFAWHPLHVESVAWVAERKDVLSAFFFMLTLGAYVRFTELKTPNLKLKSQTPEAASNQLSVVGGKGRQNAVSPPRTTDHGLRESPHASRITHHVITLSRSSVSPWAS